MRVMGVIAAVLLAGCGARYHQPPGLSETDSVAFHNALGERRYCTSPEPPSAGATAVNILAGGLLAGAIGSSPAVRRSQYETCASSLRDDGYVLLTEAPTVSADDLRARRAQQAANDAADSARRNAMR